MFSGGTKPKIPQNYIDVHGASRTPEITRRTDLALLFDAERRTEELKAVGECFPARQSACLEEFAELSSNMS